MSKCCLTATCDIEGHAPSCVIVTKLNRSSWDMLSEMMMKRGDGSMVVSKNKDYHAKNKLCSFGRSFSGETRLIDECI